MLVATVFVVPLVPLLLLAAVMLCCFIGNFYIVMERAGSMKLNRNCYEMLTFIAQMRDVKAIRGGRGHSERDERDERDERAASADAKQHVRRRAKRRVRRRAEQHVRESRCK